MFVRQFPNYVNNYQKNIEAVKDASENFSWAEVHRAALPNDDVDEEMDDCEQHTSKPGNLHHLLGSVGSRQLRRTNTNIGNIMTGLEKFKLSAVHRAAMISKDAGDTATVPFWAVASTPRHESVDTEQPTRLPPQRPDLDSDLNYVDGPTARTIKTFNCLLEQQRRRIVMEAVKPRLLQLSTDAERSWRDTELRQEVARREVQARWLLGEKLMLEQLQQEEEAGAASRQQHLQEQQRDHQQRVQERNLMIKKAEQAEIAAKEEQTRKLKEKQQQLNKIYAYQLEFRNKYQQLADIFKLCKDRTAAGIVYAAHVAKIKNLSDALNQLTKQCSAGEVSSLDLQTAAVIDQQVDAIVAACQAQVVKINEDVEKAAKEAEEKQRKEKEEELKQLQQQQQQEQEKLLQEQQRQLEEQHRQLEEQQKQLQQQESKLQEQRQLEKMSSPEPKSRLNECGDRESMNLHQTLQQHLHMLQGTYSVLVKDPNLKKFRFDCQRAVNVPVNAISPVSAAHLEDKLKRLSRLLAGQPVEADSNRTVNAAEHPSGIAFCKDLLAAKIVNQGATTVASKPEAAFPIAAVAVALWANFPDFGQLLLAHFYRMCPYLVPVYPLQLEGQSDKEYYISLGYQYEEDGTVEKQDKFLKRMSGVMQLYAAIIVTPVRRQLQKPHPHGPAKGWHWVAALLNTDPRPDISATLLFHFLEVTGSTLSAHYGQQFQKILHVICKEYFPKIEKLSCSGGPAARLEGFLQRILKGGVVPPPPGQLPSNFW